MSKIDLRPSGPMPEVESAEYDVVLTVRLRTRVTFSPIERPGPLTDDDAIQAAIGCLDPVVWSALEADGFTFNVLHGEAIRTDTRGSRREEQEAQPSKTH